MCVVRYLLVDRNTGLAYVATQCGKPDATNPSVELHFTTLIGVGRIMLA